MNQQGIDRLFCIAYNAVSIIPDHHLYSFGSGHH